MRMAASLTFCTAGSSRPMRMAMMAITTSNSIKVNPDLFPSMRERSLVGDMAYLSYQGIERKSVKRKIGIKPDTANLLIICSARSRVKTEVKKKLGRGEVTAAGCTFVVIGKSRSGDRRAEARFSG